MTKDQALSLLKLIADLYSVVNRPEAVELPEAELKVVPEAKAKP